MHTKFFASTLSLLIITSLLSFCSAIPADAAAAAATSSTTTTTKSITTTKSTTITTTTTTTQTTTPTPPTFALGTLYSRGGYSTQYIIWSPTSNTTASQCTNPFTIAATSAYTGPNHDYCNYPFDFDGYKNLTLQCGSSTATFQGGQVTGILQSDGVKTWSCTLTPFGGKVPPYSCPKAGVDPGYLPQVSVYYICQ